MSPVTPPGNKRIYGNKSQEGLELRQPFENLLMIFSRLFARLFPGRSARIPTLYPGLDPFLEFLRSGRHVRSVAAWAPRYTL